MLRSCLYFHLRLCLVVVKRFPENTYFLEMLISAKGKCFHVFGCISKNFPKNIFWCLEKNKENTNPENTSHNPEKKNHQRRKCFQSNDRTVDHASRSRSTARSREASFASIAISRRVIRAPSIARSRDLANGASRTVDCAVDRTGASDRRRDRSFTIDGVSVSSLVLPCASPVPEII